MAYSYTDRASNITFTNLPETGFTPLSLKPQYSGNTFSVVDKSGKLTPFINAVEIDWNHAYVGATYLDTTGESGCSILVPSNC